MRTPEDFAGDLWYSEPVKNSDESANLFTLSELRGLARDSARDAREKLARIQWLLSSNLDSDVFMKYVAVVLKEDKR